MVTSSAARPRRSGCPISIALELLGDAWSLLIVRDLMFKERRTFNDFLTGGEGIASNILADRLRKLEDAGIVFLASERGEGVMLVRGEAEKSPK